MNKSLAFFLLVCLGVRPLAVNAAGDPAQACEALVSMKLPNTEIKRAVAVSAGKRAYLMALFAGIPWIELPASCRVEAVARPVPGSEIGFEVWMPTRGWNGRFQGIGTGGLAGEIDRMWLGLALQKGYAAATTDSGHRASPDDGEWALNHPERITDYGHRGVHEMTVQSKAIVAAYYGRPADLSYWSGCSNGGRQGLMEAQRYPEDYDAILAGAPALDGSGGVSTWAWNQRVIRDAPDGVKLKGKLDAIERAVLASCDQVDGVKDGVIDDPRQCTFKPSSMQCSGEQDGDECLTPSQVQVMERLYAGPRGSFGDTATPGLEPGGESGERGWNTLFDGWFSEGPQYHYVLHFFRYFVYRDPKWSLDRFEFARDRAAMQREVGEPLDATSPNIRAFVKRGGKLLLFHGWSDNTLPPRQTVEYYARLRQDLGEAADESVQLFMVPGLQHCVFGPGPDNIGVLTYGQGESPANNVHAALEHWREKGVKPTRLIAAKYASELKALVNPRLEKPIRTRPLCAWPQVARWSGNGSTDTAENFRCTTP